MLQKDSTSSLTESFCTSSSLDSTNSSTYYTTTTTIPYQNITLTKVLNKAKFPVLLASCSPDEEPLAVKLFPFQRNQINRSYLNEILFANLRHPNIVPILHFEHEREATFEDCIRKVSYLIMELAPYGDFCDLMISQKVKMDDQLARTYFHQLIGGVEYLHAAGVTHLDLKLENLLLGKNYNLKICDFDQAHLKEQSEVVSRGTENFRAPELFQKGCQNLEAADIYSLGVILFALKSGGVMPYCETDKTKEPNMFTYMTQYPAVFWEKHCKIQQKASSFFDEDFKMLFMSMVALDPKERPSIEQIKRSNWYEGCIYSQENLEMIMKNNL